MCVIFLKTKMIERYESDEKIYNPDWNIEIGQI